MATQSQGGMGNFGSTGGYGGNFGGAGGATNQSGSFGGNPTNMSGGVGDAGMRQSAISNMRSGAYARGTLSPAQRQAVEQVARADGLNPNTGAPVGTANRNATAGGLRPGSAQAPAQTAPWAPKPTPVQSAYNGPVPGDQPPSWTDDRYPGATSPQPEPGFGIADPYPNAAGNFASAQPGGSTWQGNQVNNPVSNAGAKGNYEGGGIAIGGRGTTSGYAGRYERGGMIPPGQFGMVGEAGPEFVTGPARVEPMGSEQGIQMLLQALMGR